MTTKKNSTAAKKKPRLCRDTYARFRELDALRVAPEQAGAFDLFADVLTLWTRHMLAANPSAAGHVYRALFAAWKENRAESDHDERERLTVAHHGAFLNRLHELDGAKGLPATKWERERGVGLGCEMKAMLDDMLARVWRASAPYGEGVMAAPPDDLGGDPWAALGEEFEDFLEELEEEGGKR